jgi:uncharacterized protein YkuJ
MNNEAKTHVIDGKTYVEVSRKARVGEKVIIVNAQDGNDDGYENGAVFTVSSTRGRWDLTHVENDAITLYDEEYLVLEPVDQAPESLADIIANLVRRVASLERRLESAESQLRDTQNNLERQGVEIAEVSHLAKSNEADIRDLDERTQPKDKPYFTTYKPRFYGSGVKGTDDLAKRIAESVLEIIKNGGERN